MRPHPSPIFISLRSSAETWSPSAAAIGAVGSAESEDSGATIASDNPYSLHSAASRPPSSASPRESAMRTSPSAFASASIRTTVTRPTPSASAMALWVISSTKYIHAARCLRRSLRLGVRKTPLLGKSSLIGFRIISFVNCRRLSERRRDVNPSQSCPTAKLSSSIKRARARSFSLSLLSWPQAARMSRPRGVRTGLA